MTTLIASYFIDTDDKNVFLMLDSEIWHTLAKLPGEATDSGLWYIDTELSPKEVSQILIDRFKKQERGVS